MLYVGHPILAVAAESEAAAAEAIEAIKIDFQQLPHVVDPLESLFPGGPNARSNGNVAAAQINLQTAEVGGRPTSPPPATTSCPHGQAGRGVEVRRRRRRLQGGQARDRRELRLRRLSASQHGDAHDLRLLGGRQVLPARLEPEPHLGGAQHRPLHRHSAGEPRASSRSSAAAASAARSPAIPTWRSPR